MSSRTDQDRAVLQGPLRRAILKARLAPALSWIAAATGLAFVVLFFVQAGLFHYLVPGEKPPVPDVEDPGVAVTYDSTLTGVDKNNQPFEVKSKRSWQDQAVKDLIHLETVTAHFHKVGGTVYDISADLAHFNSRTKQVDMENNVVIVEQNRFTAKMAKAHADLHDKSLVSDVPVDVQFGDGNIKANGLQITNDGAKILFLNGVRAHFAGAPTAGGTTP